MVRGCRALERIHAGARGSQIFPKPEWNVLPLNVLTLLLKRSSRARHSAPNGFCGSPSTSPPDSTSMVSLQQQLPVVKAQARRAVASTTELPGEVRTLDSRGQCSSADNRSRPERGSRAPEPSKHRFPGAQIRGLDRDAVRWMNFQRLWWLRTEHSEAAICRRANLLPSRAAVLRRRFVTAGAQEGRAQPEDSALLCVTVTGATKCSRKPSVHRARRPEREAPSEVLLMCANWRPRQLGRPGRPCPLELTAGLCLCPPRQQHLQTGVASTGTWSKA
ncbi:uncharacterized protein LOC104867566 [Fukomys damarensis]|uniref:uncharacterized protein LOC104867566 n=1 Tax=Fukomys damarensis TaxID=885580 RepID=UPI00053F7097|nr:uncharacterized protein LOC104867566 [Fukomys damarensis]XP_010630284.1 uncharacterized protein LOC104867566 [Fukomys damarensis]XP_010630285.1 uncharacterized protein LOC104867566 [Fukomys damarensis]XP_010630286.1 uncharacterized protein LOC104867566 [Fukomys damarensis]XP_010630287.1 uncharacterized protein LOC104867566 [Fukomys damarensis]XP_010630288.1 uncharacterized protein LOC104867566 [Fukomys damarensis]